MLAGAEVAAGHRRDVERAGRCAKFRLFIKDDSAQGEGISRAAGSCPQAPASEYPASYYSPSASARAQVAGGLVITIAQRKGGAGKTTLATQFAEGNTLLPAFIADYNARFCRTAGEQERPASAVAHRRRDFAVVH
jgi:hypothetical protein